MQNLLVLMLAIIGASVGLLTGLIIMESERHSGPPPGSPCAYQKGTLDSIIIPSFVHESNQAMIPLEGQIDSKSVVCVPEDGSEYLDTIQNVSIQEMRFESEDSAREAIRELRAFGEDEPYRIEVQNADVEVVKSPSVKYLNLVWRTQRIVMSITIIGFEFAEDVDLGEFELIGRNIVNRILSDN